MSDWAERKDGTHSHPWCGAIIPGNRSEYGKPSAWVWFDRQGRERATFASLAEAKRMARKLSRGGDTVSERKDIIRRNPDGSVDEIIAYDLEYIHVEQMDDGHWWVGLGKRLGQPLLHIHLTSRRKIKVEVVE